MQTSRVRAVLLAVAVGAIVIGLLWMVTKISQGAVYIGNMPVYVKFPAEAPPAELIRGLGNNPITSVNRVIRYALTTDKPVSEIDIKQIRRAIPRLETVGRLYRPERITVEVEFPTHASAEFWRGRRPLWVSLIKTNQAWQVEKIYSFHYTFATPPTVWERISDALPF